MLTLPRLTLLTLVATLAACGTDPADSETNATTAPTSTTELTSTTDGTGTPTSTTAPETTGTTGTPTTDDTTGTPTTDGTTGTSDTPTTDGTTEAASGTTEEPPPALCPEHTAADACCCFEANMGFSGSVKNVCGTESLCAPAEFECNQIDESCTAKDEAAVDCTIAALADGKLVGSLVIDIDIDNNYGRRHIEIFMQGDSTAYVSDQDVLDLTGYNDVTGRYNLREPAFFEACMASMDLQDKVNCLQDVVEGEASEVCIEGFGYEV